MFSVSCNCRRRILTNGSRGSHLSGGSRHCRKCYDFASVVASGFEEDCENVGDCQRSARQYAGRQLSRDERDGKAPVRSSLPSEPPFKFTACKNHDSALSNCFSWLYTVPRLMKVAGCGGAFVANSSNNSAASA